MNPKHPVIGPVVYYIRRGDGRIKIGYASNLRRRMKELHPRELLAVEHGSRITELERHEQFAAARIDPRSEHFRPEAELLAHIAALSEAWPPPVEVLVPRYCRPAGTGGSRREHMRSEA